MKLDTQTAVVSFEGRDSQKSRYRVSITRLGNNSIYPGDAGGTVAQFMRDYDYAELYQIRAYRDGEPVDGGEWECVPWL